MAPKNVMIIELWQGHEKKTSKKTILFYVRLCLSCAIVIYLISLVDLERLIFVVTKLQIKYTWQAFFLILMAYLAVAIRWSLLLSHFEINQSIRDSWRYYMVSLFYSIVLPGIIGADVVRLGLSLKAHGQFKAILATSIIFERTCGIVVILLMASVAALLVPILMEGERPLTTLIVSIAIGALSIFFLFFVIIKVSPSSWFKNNPLLTNWKQQIIALLNHFRNISFGALSLFLVLSVLAHLFDITGCFFLSRALHIDQSFFIFLLIMPLVYVLTILPISIGGIGVREGILTFFLVKVGVLASDAVLLSLIIYLNQVLVGMVGGTLQFMNKKAIPCQEYSNPP